MSVQFHRTFHSPINKSSSKQLYSFSKADRFQPSRKSQCKSSFYNTNIRALQKRSTSFGFGNKVSFANLQGVPVAGTYTKNSQFLINKTKKRGWSFGKNQNRSLIDNQQQKRHTPGPGSYISINQKHKTGFGQSFQNISFSMRNKYVDPLQMHKNQLGPGHYPITGSISQRGNYFNSKYQNSKSPLLSRGDRFFSQKVQTPGPGHYQGNEKVNLNGTGTYFNSKYATTKGASFGISQRPSPAKKNQSPDPGKYSPFSQFGLRANQWKSGYSKH